MHPVSTVIDADPALSGSTHLPARTPRNRLATAAYCVALLGLCVGAGELTARIQDRITRGIALTAVPNWDRDLFIDTPSGKRGRPNGRYQKWTLNEYGFRGNSFALRPEPSKLRVMVLGSSETFGLYESPGAEFPAALARKLGQKYEVINAALTGMTIGSTVPYWTDWASRFSPALVVIYPSPFFYLNEGVVERRAPVADIRASQSVAASAAAESGYRDRLQSAVQGLRLVQRARERLDVPDFIQRWRDQRVIDEVTADKPPQWLFHEPPSDRADLLIRDLDALVTNVRARGAIPIVMTHASRFTDPPRERDMDWLERARVNTPRGTAVAIAQFETMVNTRLVEWASKSDVELIDIRPAIAGREELFGDLIHFNDAGAAAVASVIAAHVQTAGPRDRRQASVSAHRHAVQ